MGKAKAGMSNGHNMQHNNDIKVEDPKQSIKRNNDPTPPQTMRVMPNKSNCDYCSKVNQL
jgi:hypothetical protein